MNSIEDFDIDGNRMFVIDSRGRDYLAVFSWERGQEPVLENPPTQVEGGPFNGVAAVNGNVVVSGGTTFLNRFTYNQNGDLEGPVNFGRDRGHPDIILSSNGQYAFISTDFGIGLDIDRFGIMSLFIGDELEIPTVVSELGIPESGITEGTTSPVGFPIQSTILNDHLLVAHAGGLTIIDIIDEGGFGTSTTFNTGITGISVTEDNNIAYVIGLQNSSPALARIDLSDINNPTIISIETLATDNIPTSVATTADDIFIAAGNTGILSLPK